jgi:modulator of FtsH protease HflC
MGNRQMLGFAVIGLALITLLNSVFVVDLRERALLRAFGEIVRTEFEPGLHFKWPWQVVLAFDGRMLTLDNQTENFLTLEKKNVKVDFFVKWRIADTGQYYQATGGEEAVAMDRLAASINRGLRDQFASRTIQQALSSARGEVTKALEQTVHEVQATLGITIVDVRVKRIDFPDDVREKVYDRMRAERTRVATEWRAKGHEQAEKIKAEADRQATVMVADAYGEAERVRGEGDAKAAELYAKAYGQDPEFYRFYRSLMAYRESMRGRDVLVLEPDSEFFRYFKNAGGAAK